EWKRSPAGRARLPGGQRWGAFRSRRPQLREDDPAPGARRAIGVGEPAARARHGHPMLPCCRRADNSLEGLASGRRVDLAWLLAAEFRTHAFREPAAWKGGRVTHQVVEATAPTRIDLAGGTLDIWPLYLFHPGSVTVNVAVDRRAWCRVETGVSGVSIESR